MKLEQKLTNFRLIANNSSSRKVGVFFLPTRRQKRHTTPSHGLAPSHTLSLSPNPREVSEWFKEHAWKACLPKGIASSNLVLSADKAPKGPFLLFQSGFSKFSKAIPKHTIRQLHYQLELHRQKNYRTKPSFLSSANAQCELDASGLRYQFQ